MRSRTPLATAGLAAALVIALAGCLSPSQSAPTTEASPTTAESAPPEISVDPAQGELITGTGYSFNAPLGWTIPPDAPSMADVYLIDDAEDADDFIDTVNVILDDAPDQTLEEIETTAVAYLEGIVEATDVQVRPRVMIGGAESVHLSAQRSQSGITYWTEQYLAIYAGLAYTITFSFGETASQADRETLAESALVTWAWA